MSLIGKYSNIVCNVERLQGQQIIHAEDRFPINIGGAKAIATDKVRIMPLYVVFSSSGRSSGR